MMGGRLSLFGRVCALALGGAGVWAPACAEPIDYAALEALFEEPVTLSATGAPQRVPEAPVNMIIISQDQIRRSGAIDLPGVLERLANVDVMRSTRGQTDVAIRGYNTTLSPRLLVLLNGRQVYLDIYGMTNWDLIPVQLSEIRQIEVVSGPNTALFGFNAVAGVVNIITYDAIRDDVDEITLSIGAPDHVAGSAVWTVHATEQLGVRLSAGGFDADAWDNDDAAALASGTVSPVDPAARTLALNVGYNLSPATRLNAEATWARSMRLNRHGQGLFDYPFETNSLKLGLNSETTLGLVNAQIYSNALEVGGVDNRISLASAELIAKPAPAHTLRLAGEVRRNEIEQNEGELAYDIGAISAMWNWQATPRLALTLAARHDWLSLEREGPLPAFFPFNNNDYDRRHREWSYNAGLVYQLSDSDTLRLSAARGVGLPSLLDFGSEQVVPLMPGVTLIIAGDPNMDPVIVHNVEAGWDHALSSINGRIRLAAFWQKNEDLRAFAADERVLSFAPYVWALLPAHIGSSEMHGLEVSIEGAQGAWRWGARYSWRNIEDSLSFPSLLSQVEPARTSPEHVLTAGVDWIGERFELGADIRYQGATQQFGQETALVGVFDVDAHLLVNARATWRANQALSVELTGRNLLEDRTQSAGLSPQERAVYLTLRTSF